MHAKLRRITFILNKKKTCVHIIADGKRTCSCKTIERKAIKAKWTLDDTNCLRGSLHCVVNLFLWMDLHKKTALQINYSFSHHHIPGIVVWNKQEWINAASNRSLAMMMMIAIILMKICLTSNGKVFHTYTSTYICIIYTEDSKSSWKCTQCNSDECLNNGGVILNRQQHT